MTDLNLGSVLQQAEGIRGARLQNQLAQQGIEQNVLAQRSGRQFNELMQQFIAEQGGGDINALIPQLAAIDPARAGQIQQAQQRQQQISQEDAKRNVFAAFNIVDSKAPKALLKFAFPGVVESLESEGVNVEELTDEQIVMMANSIIEQLSPVAGIDLRERRAEQAEIALAAEADAQDLTEKQFDQIDKLIKGAKQDKRVNDFIVVSSASDRVTGASANAAGDLALVFSFMKMLDPGSVVREGEQALARNAQGVPQRVRTLYNNMLAGETLAPAQREQFKTEAAGILTASTKRADLAIKPIIARAERFNLRGESIREAVFGLPDTPPLPQGFILDEGQ